MSLTRHVSANIKSNPVMSAGDAAGDITTVSGLLSSSSGSVGWQEIAPDFYQTDLRNKAPHLATYWPGGSANAVPISWTSDLTRIDSGFTQTIPGESGVTPARFVVWVVLEDKTGARWWHVNTHFISNAFTTHPERKARWATHNAVLISTVAEMLANHGETGVVTGDFNRSHYVDADLNALGGTYHWPTSGSYGSSYYDYLITFGNWSSPSLVTKKALHSDHDAVVIDLRLAASTYTPPPTPAPPEPPVVVPPVAAPSEPTGLPSNSLSGMPVVSVWQHLEGTQWGKVAQVSAYSSLSFTPTYQDVGAWSMTLPYEAGAEVLPDRLVTVDWRGVRSTWLVESFNPSQDATGSPVLTVSGPGAVRMLGWCIVLTAPGGALTAQPVYDETKPAPINAPAETAITNMVNDHFLTRYGGHLAVPASNARGGTVQIRPKVGDNLYEVLQSAAKDGGIDFDVALVSTSGTKATLYFRIVVPADKTGSVRLRSSLGTVAAWEQADTAPGATRALVGSGDKSKALSYTWVTTPTSIAAATFWGGVREAYVDGPATTNADEIAAAGRASLADNAEGRSLAITPAEAQGMRAFIHYNVSDIATAQVVTGATATANITAIEVTVDDSGVSVKPTFGDPGSINSTLGIAKLLRALRRDVRRIERN